MTTEEEEINLNTEKERINEVFVNDVMRSTNRNGYRKKRNPLAVGGFVAELVMSIYNFVESQ